MQLREKLVRATEAAAARHIREVGGNNHGPEVKRFLAEVGLPEGYAWCDAFLSYEEHAAAGYRLPIESASVAVTFAKARELGWLVQRPQRGDLVLYDFDGDGQTDDHIGIVCRVVVIGGGFELHTVEGNTGDGSAADGDGVYLRVRSVKRGSVAYVRIPGTVPDAVAAKAHAARKKAAKPTPTVTHAPLPVLRAGAKNEAVGKLQTLLNKHGATVKVDKEFGARTEAAAVRFQVQHKLAADGVVGPHTWAALTKES